MSKFYYEGIDEVIILSVFYIPICIYILIKISKRYLLKDKLTDKILFSSFLYLYTIFLIDIFYRIIPLSPDSIFYTKLLFGNISEVNISNSYKNFGYLNKIFSMLSFSRIEFWVIFNILVSYVMIFNYWKAWLNYKRNDVSVVTQRIFLLLVIIYPSFINYTLSPLRENYISLGFALFLNGLMSRRLKNVNLYIGFLICLLIRKQMLIILFIIMILKKYTIISKKYKMNFIKKSIRLVIVLIINAIVLKFIFNYLSYNFSLEGVIRLRNYKIVAHNLPLHTYPLIRVNNTTNILKEFLGLVLQFIFAPFNIIKKFSEIGIFMKIDGLFVTTIFISSLKSIIKEKEWGLYIIILILINSLYEFHITGAVRHRYFFIFLVLILFSENLNKKLQKGIK